jgi:hypothetical protein
MRVPRAAALLLALLAGAGCGGSRISDRAFDDLVERTVRARGIPLRAPVDARLIGRDEVDETLHRQFRAEWRPEEIAAYQQALTAVGLWPSDRDLETETFAVYAEEAVGLYVPPERILYLVGDAPGMHLPRLRRDPAVEITLAHEVVHVIQHQAYPHLMDVDPFWKSQDDVAAAVRAALEGDATRYGLEAGAPRELPAPADYARRMDSEVDLTGDGALARAPALIRGTLAFPYTSGYRLSYAEGAALLETVPVSTEQALHAERRRDPFLAIDLGPLRSALPAGCRFVYENSVGELALSVLFEEHAAETAPDAWHGWDGDRYLVAECGSPPELLWLTAWDSERDAVEFEEAYRGVAAAVAARGRLSAPPETVRAGREVTIATPGLAELLPGLGTAARRARIGDLAALRAHFAADAAPAAR